MLTEVSWDSTNAMWVPTQPCTVCRSRTWFPMMERAGHICLAYLAVLWWSRGTLCAEVVSTFQRAFLCKSTETGVLTAPKGAARAWVPKTPKSSKSLGPEGMGRRRMRQVVLSVDGHNAVTPKNGRGSSGFFLTILSYYQNNFFYSWKHTKDDSVFPVNSFT